MEPFFNLRIPTAPVYELPLFSLFLSLLFNAGVRIWVLSSSALNVSQRICIVISSAQNLRERKRASVLCFRRTMIIFPSSHSHTLYAMVYSSASIRPGLVSYRVSRAMRPSLIAAGRLFPSREPSPLRRLPARSWLGDILFRVKRPRTQSKTNPLNQILIQIEITLTASFPLLNIKS